MLRSGLAAERPSLSSLPIVDETYTRPPVSLVATLYTKSVVAIRLD